MSTHYASGTWHVKAGHEDEFVTRWLAFTSWTKDTVPGAGTFVLIRDVEDSQHFVSFGTWADAGSRKAWKESDGFAERFARCRELCDLMQGSDYELVASPTLVG